MVGVRTVTAVAVVVLLSTGGVAATRGDDADRPVPTARRPAEASASESAWSDAPAPPTTVVVAHQAPEPRPAPAPAESARLLRFRDCRTLVDHVRRAALEHVTAYGLSGGEVATDGATAAPAPAAAEGGSAGGDRPGFSGTNAQEAGVDEPDVVKNDARRAFAVFEGRLRAVVLGAGGPRLVGELDLGLGRDVELLEVGDRLVAMASTGPFATALVVVDTADPAALRVVRRIELEGAYLSARRIGDTVRVVVTQRGPAFGFTSPRSSDRAEQAKALEHNRRAVLGADLAEWLPDVNVVGGPRLVPAPACDATYVTSTFAGPGSTTVVTVSPAEAAVVDASAVLASATEVYSSTDHLYVATSAWDRSSGEVTEIHRFDVSDPRRSEYEATGSVPGHLLRPPGMVGPGELGQWSMSEHGGDLRVATTVVDRAGSVNAVTVLRRDSRRLVPIGVLTGLGAGEQLYAVRFLGTRGYVVTYRMIDPLYVLDLGDPRAPRALGELKVPGYSAYLHPLDAGTLLGVGQADDDGDGVVDGSQVSVFDVSDPTRPRRRSTRQLGDRGSRSGAETDPRSFTWWPDPSRVVVTLADWADPNGFHGAVVLDPTGEISELGRIEHRIEGSACAMPIVRSRVIGDALLTFSAAGIEVHALGDVAPRHSLRYAGVTPPCRGERPPPERTRGPLPATPGAAD